MMRMIVATENPGKMKEIKALMSDMPLEVLSMGEAGYHPVIVENGMTFSENAMTKAESLGVLPDTIVVGDDSGFCIDALNGEPGLYSARFLSKFSSREEAFKNLLERLTHVHGEDRSAYFETDVALLFPDGTKSVVSGKLCGLVADRPKGENGFGYDPILFYPPLGKTTAELTSEEKNAISHRSIAFQKAKEEIQKYMRH